MVGGRASPNNRLVRTAPSRVTDRPVSAARPSGRLACRGSDSRKGRTGGTTQDQQQDRGSELPPHRRGGRLILPTKTSTMGHGGKAPYLKTSAVTAASRSKIRSSQCVREGRRARSTHGGSLRPRRHGPFWLVGAGGGSASLRTGPGRGTGAAAAGNRRPARHGAVAVDGAHGGRQRSPAAPGGCRPLQHVLGVGAVGGRCSTPSRHAPGLGRHRQTRLARDTREEQDEGEHGTPTGARCLAITSSVTGGRSSTAPPTRGAQQHHVACTARQCGQPDA